MNDPHEMDGWEAAYARNNAEAALRRIEELEKRVYKIETLIWERFGEKST